MARHQAATTSVATIGSSPSGRRTPRSCRTERASRPQTRWDWTLAVGMFSQALRSSITSSVSLCRRKTFQRGLIHRAWPQSSLLRWLRSGKAGFAHLPFNQQFRFEYWIVLKVLCCSLGDPVCVSSSKRDRNRWTGTPWSSMSWGQPSCWRKRPSPASLIPWWLTWSTGCRGITAYFHQPVVFYTVDFERIFVFWGFFPSFSTSRTSSSSP